jgi:hypothetical protein
MNSEKVFLRNIQMPLKAPPAPANWPGEARVRG